MNIQRIAQELVKLAEGLVARKPFPADVDYYHIEIQRNPHGRKTWEAVITYPDGEVWHAQPNFRYGEWDYERKPGSRKVIKYMNDNIDYAKPQ